MSNDIFAMGNNLFPWSPAGGTKGLVDGLGAEFLL